jgi:hypothetical protein
MKRRKDNSARLAAEMTLAGMHTFMTLWHRLPSIAASCATGGRTAHPEYGRMIGEKTAAMLEGTLDAQAEAMRIAAEAATGRMAFADMAGAPARIAAAGLRPAFRRVKANSQRLGRRTKS